MESEFSKLSNPTSVTGFDDCNNGLTEYFFFKQLLWYKQTHPHQHTHILRFIAITIFIGALPFNEN